MTPVVTSRTYPATSRVAGEPLSQLPRQSANLPAVTVEVLNTTILPAFPDGAHSFS